MLAIAVGQWASASGSCIEFWANSAAATMSSASGRGTGSGLRAATAATGSSSKPLQKRESIAQPEERSNAESEEERPHPAGPEHRHCFIKRALVVAIGHAVLMPFPNGRALRGGIPFPEGNRGVTRHNRARLRPARLADY